MQHPEFKEGPARLLDPIRVPQPDGKSALAIDPELNCKRDEQRPRSANRARRGRLRLAQGAHALAPTVKRAIPSIQEGDTEARAAKAVKIPNLPTKEAKPRILDNLERCK